MVRLAFTETQFVRLTELLSSRETAILCGMGQALRDETREWPCHAVDVGPEHRQRTLEVRPANNGQPLSGQVPTSCVTNGVIVLDPRGPATRFDGWIDAGNRRERISAIRLLAPGLPVIYRQTAEDRGRTVFPALGDLHYAVIGTGHIGSLVADSLSTFGARRLTLIDPAWDDTACLRRAAAPPLKATALTDTLSQKVPALSVTTVAADVKMPCSLEAAAPADVIWCCVNDDAARLAAAAVATSYLKPMVDISVCVASGMDRRQPSADVRLVLDEGCVGCMSGLSTDDATCPRVALEWPGRSVSANRSWHSYPDFNRDVVDAAVGLWRDCLSGTRGNTWLRLTSDGGERASFEYRSPAPDPTCSVCARRGLADSAMVVAV